MLKKVSCLLIIFLQSFNICFLPSIVYAASESLVVYQLKTGDSGAATQEFISIYNNTLEPQDITDWCVTKSSTADTTQSQLGCIVAPGPSVKIMLPSHSTFTLATIEFINAQPGFVPDLVFTADIAATSGHIRILNPAKQEVDRLGWGNAVHPETAAVPAHALGKILQRVPHVDDELIDTDNNLNDFTQATLTTLPSSSLYEEEMPVDICSDIADIQTSLPDGFLFDTNGNCRQDMCTNINLLQIDVPDGYTAHSDNTCSLVPLEDADLIITELLPNAMSYDSGKEFIEIYNPNNRNVSLKGYVLQMGPAFNKSYAFPGNAIMLPNSYISFSDTDIGMVLPNTSASLRLIAQAGNVVSETGMYLSPGEEASWALIGVSWQYTNQPTPGVANVPSLDEPSDDKEIIIMSPCPTGQYRNTDTNRCRLLTSAVSAVIPCKIGQERNPETNRCRTTVLSAASSLSPCKKNQERNPETNRCHDISSNTLGACSEGQERNPETNRCRKVGLSDVTLAKVQDVATDTKGSSIRWWLVGAAVCLALGYALFEWRRDIANLVLKYRAKNNNSTG